MAGVSRKRNSGTHSARVQDWKRACVKAKPSRGSAQEREGEGKKRVRELPCYLAKLWAVNLSRRRHGVDGEMATTREKEDTTMKRTTS